MGVHATEFLAGLLLVAVILFDAFQTVVLPRPTPALFRPSAELISMLYRLTRWTAARVPSPTRQEQLLGTFAPFCVVVLLLCWVAGLIVGYGLMLNALVDQIKPPPASFGTTVYFSGTALLTIGFGDFVPTGGLPRFITLLEGATGLGVVAVVITFLFGLFGEFQGREVLVITLSARAGAPPSGVTLLQTYATQHMLDRLPDLFADWELWSARVLDSHLSYPLLAYFRSTHDQQSWISALGAVLDAATLLLTTIDDQPPGPATFMHRIGTHLVEDLAQHFGLDDEQRVYVERHEFEEARERLLAAGFRLRDVEESWTAFAKSRAAYASALNAMAGWWVTPPAEWIGDRSVSVHHDRRSSPH